MDFVLTIAISSAAGASALIAYVPALAAWRIPLALALTAAVAAVTWLGHLGRSIFAVMTCAFIVITAAVLVSGLSAPVHPSGTITTHPRSGRADRGRAGLAGRHGVGHRGGSTVLRDRAVGPVR
ncbi:MAG TPA: hypothetical protein VGG05_06245 [Pseudonocardiaceae bacterium]